MRRPGTNGDFHNNGTNHTRIKSTNSYAYGRVDPRPSKIGSPSRGTGIVHFVVSFESDGDPDDVQEVEESVFQAAASRKRKRQSACSPDAPCNRQNVQGVALSGRDDLKQQVVDVVATGAGEVGRTIFDVKKRDQLELPQADHQKTQLKCTDDDGTSCRLLAKVPLTITEARNALQSTDSTLIDLKTEHDQKQPPHIVPLSDLPCSRSSFDSRSQYEWSFASRGPQNQGKDIPATEANTIVSSSPTSDHQCNSASKTLDLHDRQGDTAEALTVTVSATPTYKCSSISTSTQTPSSSVATVSRIPHAGKNDPDNCPTEIVFEDFDPYSESRELADLCRTKTGPRSTAALDVKKVSLPVISQLNLSREGASSRPAYLPWLRTSERYASRRAACISPLLPDKQCIHADFSYLEVLRIMGCLWDGPWDNLTGRLERDLPVIAPGRAANDILNFVVEHEFLCLDDSILPRQMCGSVQSLHVQHETKRDWLHRRRKLSCGPASLTNRELGHDQSSSQKRAISREAALPGLLKADKIFRGTSGDVNAVSFSPTGKEIIVGSVATSDEYNRSGNLVMFIDDLMSGNTRCHVLDAQNLSSNKYPTISCLDYVREGQYFIIGGTDETLKVYSANGRFLHDKSRKSRIGTHDIAVSSKHESVAFTCHSSGHLDVHTFRSDGVSNTYNIHQHRTLTPATAVFHNDLDQLIVGYQSDDQHLVAGQASIIDATKMTIVHSLKGEESYAHICAGPNGLWAAGTNSRGKGIVRVVDARSAHAIVSSFTNDQDDINEVAMCENLVTSVATEGSCYVWDIRNSSSKKPLHVLRHGTPIQATGTKDVCGITGSFFFNHSRFVTGGSDGIVKLWDLGIAEPWIKDMVQVVSPITRLAVSRDKDRMLVGENRGDVHLWSVRGDGIEEQLMEEPLSS